MTGSAAALDLLDAVVDRHGPDVLGDAVALEGALRMATAPPPEAQLTAMVGAAATGASARMRAARAEGAGPDAVIAAGTEVAGD
ncbi:hypothetical protein, partial [Pseudonocardia lacus]|uniref:hypothetical protein n=1 Tax=Pseudonocardia lacus TaxID=2835865 RepID=UPI001BDC9E98